MKLFGLIKLTTWLFGAKPKEIVMAKADVVAAGITAIQSGVTQVYTDQLGVAYDGGFTDGVASVPAGTGGGFQQSDIDAAVAAAIAPLNQSISDLTAKDAGDVQALADAKVASDAAVADLQGKLDTLAAAKSVDDGIISGLQGALQQIKDAEAALQSLFPPPAPVDPAPVDPAPAA